MRGSPITAAVAALALVVGAGTAVGGYVTDRAADHKVCQVKDDTNEAIRKLVDDFVAQNPDVTPEQRTATDKIVLRRFPDLTC